MNATVEDLLVPQNVGTQIRHVVIAEKAPPVGLPPTVGG